MYRALAQSHTAARPHPWIVRSAAVLLTVTVSALAHADIIDWDNSSGGLFGVHTNWNPQTVPIAADTARFALADTYTVTFDQQHSIGALQVTNGNVTFNLAGPSAPALESSSVHAIGGANVAFTVTGGELKAGSGTTIVGNGANQDVTMTVTGAGTVWDVGGQLRVGNGGANCLATLVVENGGNVQTGATLMIASGNNVATEGHLIVSGTGSNISGPNINVGTQIGSATLLIENGATVTTTARNNIATAVDSTGVATVTGAGSEWSVTQFRLAGGANAPSSGADGTLIVDDSGRLVASQDFTNWTGGTVRGANDGAIHMTGASVAHRTVTNHGVFAPGLPGETGTLAITSPTSNAIYSQQVDATNGTGTLRIRLEADGVNDMLSVDGDINLAGVLDILPFGGYQGFDGHEFTILSWTGELTGTFDSIDAFALPPYTYWDFDDLYTLGQVRIFVPEPASMSLLAVGAWLLLGRRRGAAKTATQRCA